MQLYRARRKLKEALLQACEFSRDERGVFVCQPKLPDRQDSIRIPVVLKKFL